MPGSGSGKRKKASCDRGQVPVAQSSRAPAEIGGNGGSLHLHKTDSVRPEVDGEDPSWGDMLAGVAKRLVSASVGETYGYEPVDTTYRFEDRGFDSRRQPKSGSVATQKILLRVLINL